MKFAERKAVTAGIGLQRELCGVVSAVNTASNPVNPVNPAECAPDPELILGICRHPQGPDFVVLPHDIGLPTVARWHFDSPGQGKTLWLYDCAKLSP